MHIDHISDFINSRRFSSITTSNPDPNLYPNYYKARRYEVVLNEGDMIYIPFGWFHHVFSEDVNEDTQVNLAINFWKHTTKDEYTTSLKKYAAADIVSYSNVSNEIYNLYETDNFPFITHLSKDSFSFSRFHESMSNVPFYYQKSKTTVFESTFVDKELEEDETCNISEFLKIIQDDSRKVYITQNNITKYKDIECIKSLIPSFYKNFNEISLWMNKGSISSSNHFDSLENILCQLQGKKRLFLFPPSERHNLYLHNPFNLQFILDTYKKLTQINKSIEQTKKDIYIKTYDSVLDLSVCKSIIQTNQSAVQVVDILPKLDNLFFNVLTQSIRSYINYIIDTQNVIPPMGECVDSGYYIQCINDKEYLNNYPRINNTILKYIWFLNDSTPAYINGIEIEAIAGRLLIYPAHFTYIEKEIDTVKNKWICFGYLYHPRRDSNPQSYD